MLWQKCFVSLAAFIRLHGWYDNGPDKPEVDELDWSAFVAQQFFPPLTESNEAAPSFAFEVN